MSAADFTWICAMTARILHLTDLHLFADPATEIRGVKTRETFERVLVAVSEQFSSTDQLVVTGDLTHDEKLETYQFLRDRMSPWISKLRLVPGNHDDRALMRTVFGDRIMSCGERIVFADDVDGWRLIGLDSHVPGQLHGELGAAQLDWLAEELNSHPNRPTCLFLHHPTESVSSTWLDRIGLLDAVKFRNVALERPQIRAVLSGHIHQELTICRNRVAILATPSTGVQFRPGTEMLEVDTLAPGFRVVELDSDGTLRTHVERIRV